jgi:general L-amino acid transport system substrate-binding protein
MKKPDDWMFILETIGGMQALGSFTRLGDQAWSRLVKWVQYAMVEGEVLGVTQSNAEQTRQSTKDPEMRRYLGLEGDFGKLLGVDNAWAYRIAKDIGSYGEVYEATFGDKGLKLPRGMNNLYTKGGLFMTPSWK